MRSVASERHGIPVGWAIDGANRNDVRMLEPTLDAVSDAGLLDDIGTSHLDRSYDSPAVQDRLRAAGIEQFEIQRRGTKLPGVKRQPLRLGLRWVVRQPTRGGRTTGSSAATPTGEPATATPPSAWPPPSSSSAGSSTGATDGVPDGHLSAQVLSDACHDRRDDEHRNEYDEPDRQHEHATSTASTGWSPRRADSVVAPPIGRLLVGHLPSKPRPSCSGSAVVSTPTRILCTANSDGAPRVQFIAYSTSLASLSMDMVQPSSLSAGGTPGGRFSCTPTRSVPSPASTSV